jgi:hypothetical protein
MDIQNRNHAAIAGQKGVVGTFTGLDEDGNVVIKVYTTGADNPQIPKAIEGVDVLEVLTGPIHKLQTTPGAPQRQQRLGRPVPIGITAFSDTDLSATSCAAGTLGCRLRDNHGNFYALSNNHVFAGVNGTQGKDPNGLPPEIPVAGPFQIPGTNIVQPAPGDDNCAIGNAPDIIGVLVAFVFIDTTSINFVDCAIAKTTPQLVNTSTLADGYGAPTSTTVLPFLGQKVQKYGRTSGYTTGTVTGINGIALIDFDGPKALFAREIEITGISPAFFPSYGVPGDSGSLVVDMNRNPVALLHAGGGGITLCNPIRLVLAFLADELMAHPGLPQDIVLTVDDAKPTQVSKEGRANPEPNNLP